MRKPHEINILIGCEESQAVCKAFRELGFNAYSCDLLPCSGGHPEWHIQGDVFEAIKSKDWDLGIFHPECTRLTVTANKWYKPEYSERFPNIHEERKQAIEFFMKIVNCGLKYYAIENPIGIMSTHYRKPNQIIQPYQFGDPERKSTCLWTHNLPKLDHTNVVEPNIITFKSGKTMSSCHLKATGLPKEERRKARSVTFPGIAKAIAEQWGKYLLTQQTKNG